MPFINFLWSHWSPIFQPLPYGDPYVAVAAFLLALVMVGKLIKGIMEY